MKKTKVGCELCDGEAALRCESDCAFLCWGCDARVHGANFLVSRHPRRLICVECGSAEGDQRPVSGPGFLPLRFLCRSCTDHGDGGALSSESESSSCCSSTRHTSASSSCVSSAESGAAAGQRDGGGGITSISPSEGASSSIKFARSIRSAAGSSPRRERKSRRIGGGGRELDARAEGALLSWCRRVGLDDPRAAAAAAAHALAVGMQRMPSAPFRAIAAAALWFAVKTTTSRAAAAAPLLRQVEACSGVPAKLILAAEARISRAIRRCHVGEEGEGWAECSSS
ncbi:unnamed protein product [Spirodela intermedia]|uniref:B box-type domain-containing protein n=1 Tax=Spirodela intermedia TaxID=51605 RepID=A0A7I8LBK8_SPIIN|nr:unnamed protein product [Spirodela intermedia]